MMREVLPFMKAKKNVCIINVSSKAGVSSAVAVITYTASKHGLVSISNRLWGNLITNSLDWRNQKRCLAIPLRRD
jgi:short-subunit dehydrogenase